MNSPAEQPAYLSKCPKSWASETPIPAGAGYFQFGFESEYADPTPFLREFYVPTAEFRREGEPPEATAQRLIHEARALAHGDHRPLLQKIGGPAFLPETIFRDDTGNFELVLAPVGSPAEFRRQIEFVNKSFGVGSLQAMVSLPREEFFRDQDGALGWLHFFQELDTMERLERGRSRGPGEVVRSFLHPYLGPMIELRHRALRKYLRENAEGRLLDGEEIKRIGKREHSFKFVGGTAYRPDIAPPFRTCLEIRDAHRDPALLLERVSRVLYYWQKERKAFRPFASAPAFDSAAAFASLPEGTQGFLRRVAAIYIPERVRAHEKPLFAYEVFRNFAYPLREWKPYAELLPGVSLARVEEAQSAYLADLRRAEALEGSGARSAIQEALARFPRASGLLDSFRVAESQLAEVLRG